MISVQHITKRFGKTIAVNDVSFEIQQGEKFVMLGTSGSGKTTMLRMINRLIDAEEGTILVNNKNILNTAPGLLRRQMGYVLQGYGLFPHYTVAENIAVVPKLLRWPHEKINQRVENLLKKLQLSPSEYRDVYPASLSGGQKQRVGLARALAAEPPILLMDEPFGALDPLTRADVRSELMQLDELKDRTVILVTHDVQEAFELGDKICLMDNGRIIQQGTPADLLFNPSSVFVRSFFSKQLLQLELQALSIGMFWDDLPAAKDDEVQMISSNKNLWEAMALLTDSKEPVIVHDEQSGQRKVMTFADLQTAMIKRKHLN